MGEGPTQGLNDTTSRVEGKYSIIFTKSEKRFVLSLHYNENNSFVFVNVTKIFQFKTKNSEIEDYALCLGNISKDFKMNNIKKNRIKRSSKFFFLLILILFTLTIF